MRYEGELQVEIGELKLFHILIEQDVLQREIAVNYPLCLCCL